MSLTLDRDRSALLLLDFQRDVCAPGGRMLSPDPEVQARFAAAIATAATILAAARAARLRTIHVRHAFAPGHPELLGLRHRTGMQRYMIGQGAFVDGAPGSEIVAPLVPIAGEAVLRKTTISPFASTDLGERLAAAGVETVVLTGFVTHYVVYTTAVAASDLGLRVVVVRDACASANPETHATVLSVLGPIAELRDAAELVAALA